jgi:hypothetical protein
MYTHNIKMYVYVYYIHENIAKSKKFQIQNTFGPNNFR